jgi:predicted type IV restriction endonuclease
MDATGQSPMSLETTLADIVARLGQRRFSNERPSSQGIVLRVLHELGWDIYDKRRTKLT